MVEKFLMMMKSWDQLAGRVAGGLAVGAVRDRARRRARDHPLTAYFPAMPLFSRSVTTARRFSAWPFDVVLAAT
jgi:hypothetical protein